MAKTTFDDVDRVILDKWSEVSELVEAYQAVRDKLRTQLEDLGEQLEGWAKERDFQLEVDGKGGELRVFKRTWVRPNRDKPWACLTVGGFEFDGVFKGDDSAPYACVYCLAGKGRKSFKDSFYSNLRGTLDPEALALWNAATSTDCPLNQYSKEESCRALLLDSEKFLEFVTDQLNELVEFADPVSNAISVAVAASADQVASAGE